MNLILKSLMLQQKVLKVFENDNGVEVNFIYFETKIITKLIVEISILVVLYKEITRSHL